MNHLFCFVSSKCTENYSKLALDSFFKHTKLEPEDLFVFINNDKTNAFKEEYPISLYINNETPLNWSANFNQGLKIAKEKKMHFVVITNDVVFTKEWFEPLKQRDDLILIPSSNINFLYRSKDFNTKVNMYYEEYVGKEQYLEAITDFHQNNNPFNKIQEKIFMQFYLARIPYQIHSDVGFFDEKFCLGGEDMDYRIRAAIKGHKTMLAMHSFILHFQGKSTWDGQETSEEEVIRRNNYINYSIEKWGEDITEIFIKSDIAKEHAHKIGLGKEFDSNQQYDIIRKLKNNYA